MKISLKKTTVKAVALALALITCIPLFASCKGASSDFSLPTRQLTDDAEKTYGGYKYKVYDDGSAIITAYTGSEAVLNIPDKFESYTVREIAADVFMDNTSLVYVKFNKSLEIIGDYSFCGCTSLSQISFNSKLWSIGLAAFEETAWESAQTDEFVIVGDGVLLKYLGTSTDVRMPDNVKHISYAFAMNFDVVNIEMGPSVLTVGSAAFAYCTAIRRVKLGENVMLIGEGAFDGCENMTYVNIPSKVQVISTYAFNYCTSLTNIQLGSNVSRIAGYAFRNCIRLKNVTVENPEIKIEGYAFADCYSLTLVEYNGSEEQFKALALDGTNRYFTDAKKIFARTEVK